MAALSFSRDGHTLVATTDDAVTLTDLRTGQGQIVAIPSVAPIAAVGFADQVWIAAGVRPALTRHTLGGALLGPPIELPHGPAGLVAAVAGAPAAVWTAAQPTAFIEDGDTIQRFSCPVASEIAIPLTGRRWVTIQGTRVVAPSGLSCELPLGTRVRSAAITLDGTALAIVTQRGTGGELVLVGLTNGKLAWRMPMAAPQLVRVAARRGLAIALVEPRRFAVIDLRGGRLLGHGTAPFDILDLALDPDGQRIALREGARQVEVISVRDVLAPPPVETVDATAPELIAEVATIDVVTAAPEVRPPAFTRPFELRTLQPVTSAPRVPSCAALELLDGETRAVALWTLRAIAVAWDTRQLGYGNEGRHPYEHEVAALLGMNRGFAKDYLEATSTYLADHAIELARTPDRRGPATPIGALAAEFGLGPLAIDILLAVAAPALWSGAARLYGILANDPSRTLLDEALLEQILRPRCTRHELAAELDPRAPLVRLGAIRVDGRARPFAGLEVDPIVLARLRCEDPDLGSALTARGADRAIEDLAIGDGVIAAALEALARTPAPARIVLRGRGGSGRRTLLAALAAEAGRPLGIVDATMLPRADMQFAIALRSTLRRAHLAGLLPCVVGLDEIAFAERSGCEVATELLRAHAGPVAVVLPATADAPFAPGHVAIDLPVLPESVRVAVWTSSLADAGLAVRDRDALAARYRIGPGLIHRAIAAVRDRGAAPADATLEIERFIRQMRDTRLGAHAHRVTRLATWDTLVLPSDVTDSLRELVSRVRHRRLVFETWGMEKTMATSRGLTALFAGQPGTGKTLVAGVIARELGLDLYQIDLSKVMSKWLGETERNLATIFDAAEDGQVILLFDEADSLFSKRTEVRSSNDRYANLEVNYLLQRLDTFEGIAILTTNSDGAIDPAFKRRMSFRLSFPFPDEETRERLWRVHLPAELPIAGPLALDRIAHKYQIAGGYIRNACLRAAFLAAQDRGVLDQSHLDRAVALEFAELGKLTSSGSLD